jgi:hypothetical protein
MTNVRPPELQIKWLRSHAWLVALIGLVLEAAATIPFALLDVSAPEASAALAMLIGAAVAFVVGPRWGALVSAAGWGLFFAFVADQEARAILALPVWLAVAILAGLASVESNESVNVTPVSSRPSATRPRAGITPSRRPSRS